MSDISGTQTEVCASLSISRQLCVCLCVAFGYFIFRFAASPRLTNQTRGGNAFLKRVENVTRRFFLFPRLSLLPRFANLSHALAFWRNICQRQQFFALATWVFFEIKIYFVGYINYQQFGKSLGKLVFHAIPLFLFLSLFSRFAKLRHAEFSSTLIPLPHPLSSILNGA